MIGKRWRAEAREAIRQYPALLRKQRELQNYSIIANYSGARGQHEAHRVTEDVALRQLPPDDARDLEAVSMALDTIRRYRNGDLRYKLVQICYWQNTHTIDGAALLLHVHEKTAHEWDRGFIELVDAYRRIY